ncbi:MAG: hypothetical protein ACLFVV_21235 [Coleofasciculus sp.]
MNYTKFLRKLKGFSSAYIIFAHNKPTIDSIPENRTIPSQSL